MRYEHADGDDLVAATQVAATLTDWVRETRRPAMFHLSTVRLMGHAGSDAELAYRTAKEITADYGRDRVSAQPGCLSRVKSELAPSSCSDTMPLPPRSRPKRIS